MCIRVACVSVQIKVFQLTRWYLFSILRLLNIDIKRAKIEERRIDLAFCNGKYSHAAVNSVLNYGNQICLHMSNWPCSGMLIKLTYTSAVDKIQFAGLSARTHTRKHTLFD